MYDDALNCMDSTIASILNLSSNDFDLENFQVDLEPMGKIHVIVELKWHGKIEISFVF